MGRVKKPCRGCCGPKNTGRGFAYCTKCHTEKGHGSQPKAQRRRTETGGSVPPADRAEMVRLYVQEKLSLKDTGERLYWSAVVVKAVLISEGVTLRPTCVNVRPHRHHTPEALEEAAALYRSGLSMGEVARKLGIGVTTAHRRIHAAGVQVRTAGESQAMVRFREIEQGGASALTDLQRAVLGVVERSPGITTTGVARELCRPTRSARRALDDVQRFGLIKSTPGKTGHGRPFEWRRTEIAVVDVYREATRPKLPPGKSDRTLPIDPLRDWIVDLIARERRALMHTTIRELRRTTDPEQDKAPEAAVRLRLKIDGRTFHRIRKEQDTVTFGLADRILTNANGPRMEELWPELERELEEAA